MFLVVEQKEPHAARMAFASIVQPENIQQRTELARRMKDELELPMDVLVDAMDDSSRALFGDLPSPAFVIDASGAIVAKFPWAEASLIEKAIQ